MFFDSEILTTETRFYRVVLTLTKNVTKLRLTEMARKIQELKMRSFKRKKLTYTED
jgi:hypothetical protein